MAGLTIESVDPVSGPTAGGTAVAIVGSNFDLGTNTVAFGGTPATSVVVVDPEHLTCVTPAHAAGVVDVALTSTAADPATLVGGFEFIPPPEVTSASPDSGPVAGGTEVLVNGDGFQDGLTLTFGGVAATGVSVSVPDQITCTIPAHAAGAVDVVVTNPDTQTDTLGAGFEYIDPPVLELVTPSRHPTYGGRVTLTGTGFRDGATVTVRGVACTDVEFISSTELAATVPPGVAGPADVVLTNPEPLTSNSDTLTAGFTYAREYRELRDLLPPGLLWDRDTESEFAAMLVATGDEFVRVLDRGADLMEEADPRTATETLAEWERMLGLPDDLVTEIPATIAGRRVAIASKFVSRGGQNFAFFSNLFAIAGYFFSFGSQLHKYSTDLLRVFNESNATGNFRVGSRVFGTSFAYTIKFRILQVDFVNGLTRPELERLVRNAVHSHIQVVFEYLN